MKAIVTLTVGLILVSTTFAQSSRRSEGKENNTQTNNKRSETVSTERRPSSENSRTTDVSSTNRRSFESQSAEKKAEVNTNNQESERNSVSTVNSERRSPSENSGSRRTESSNTNRRSYENQSTERKVDVSTPGTQTNTVNQDRSSVTNRRNSSVNNNTANNSKPSVSSTRNYDNNRREPSGNRDQVIVQEHSRRTVEPRHHTVVHKSYRPVPVEVRRVKYPYRAPVRTEVIWTVDLSRRFEVYYPAYRPYRYHVGMRIATVSAYDAFDFVGEIARVYGRVAETYYSWETDEYFLYLGDYYPYHDFSVVIPGREARDFSRRPEKFFDREYIEVTGLITRFEGKPEMIIKRSSQVSVY